MRSDSARCIATRSQCVATSRRCIARQAKAVATTAPVCLINQFGNSRAFARVCPLDSGVGARDNPAMTRGGRVEGRRASGELVITVIGCAS